MARTIDLGKVVGPQGPQGPQGPEGPQGPQGPQGPVATKEAIGLGNVDNTSDADKPVSNAMQIELDKKADDNAVVKLTGKQTIVGKKKFINGLDLILGNGEKEVQLRGNKGLDKVDQFIAFSFKEESVVVTSFNFCDTSGEWKKNVSLDYNRETDELILSGTNLKKVKGSAFAAASMPSNSRLELELPESGEYWKSPFNGWIVFGMVADAQGQMIKLESSKVRMRSTAATPGQQLIITLPVCKDDHILFSYSCTGNVIYLYLSKSNAEVE